MLKTFGGSAFGAPPLMPGTASVLFAGTGTLSFTATPAMSGTALFFGRGKLNIPGGVETDTFPVRVMALRSGILASSQRYALQAELETATAGYARSGLFPNVSGAADLLKVNALQAKVTPFQAFIAGTASGQPGYRVTVDEDVVLTFAPGSGGNPRIDLVVVRVRDDPYDGSGAQTGTVEVVQGTPGSSPVSPTAPATSLPLWQVTVPGSTTAAVGLAFATARTDVRTTTTALGGAVPVTSQTERDAIPTPHMGMRIWRRDWGWHEVYDGVAWRVRGVPSVSSNAALSAITNPIDGQVATIFSTNDLLQWDSATGKWVSFVYSALPVGYGAWQQFTPTLNQAGTVNVTVPTAAYMQVGRIVTAAVWMSVTSTGIAGNPVRFSLPVPAARSTDVVGRATLYDNSASTYYSGPAVLDTTTLAKIVRAGSAPGFLGATGGFTAALGSGDVITYTLTYESAA